MSIQRDSQKVTWWDDAIFKLRNLIFKSHSSHSNLLIGQVTIRKRFEYFKMTNSLNKYKGFVRYSLFNVLDLFFGSDFYQIILLYKRLKRFQWNLKNIKRLIFKNKNYYCFYFFGFQKKNILNVIFFTIPLKWYVWLIFLKKNAKFQLKINHS